MSDHAQPGGIRRRLTVTAAVAALMVAPLAVATTASAGTPPDNIDRQLWAELAGGAPVPFWVYLDQTADLSAAPVHTAATPVDRAANAKWVFERLTAVAESSQADLRTSLTARGIAHTPYWISNVIHVTGDGRLARELANRPDVSHLESASEPYQLIEPVSTGPAPGHSIQAIEWGVANIDADDVWTGLGVTGQGITVATIDTGVRHTHSALANQYRGSITGSHDYNWFDPAGICPSAAPCDNNNHGTHVTGTMVGDDGGGNQIGVAPGAQWIAAKGCETGSCSQSSLLASGQWMLAPTRINGTDPEPGMAPHVVNNSWGGGRGNTWYQATINAWINAGIFPMFAAGNSGPGCNTANSPGDNIPAYAVGAYDINNQIASFSSRGFSGVDGTTIKPNVSAPGVAVRSAVASGDNSYSSFNGTSMATPHASGVVALLWSASDQLRGDVAATRALLDVTATDTGATGCGGTVDNNNIFGQGRINALAAVDAAPRGPSGTLSGRVTDAASGAGVAGARVTAEPGGRSALTGTDGSYSLSLAPGRYDVTASHGRYQPQAVTGVDIVQDQTTSRDFVLTPLPTGSLAGTVTAQDTGQPVAGATVTVSGPEPAATTTGAQGDYSFGTLVVGTYSVTVSAVGYHSRTVTGVVVNPDQTTTRDVVLVPNVGNVTGTVTSQAHGQPVANARVRLLFGPGGSYEAFTDVNGQYLLTGVVSGSYTVHTTATGCFLDSSSVTVQDGQTTVHNVQLSGSSCGPIPTGTLAGQVTSQVNGVPVAGARVNLFGGPEVLTDANGNYLIAGVPVGSYTVHVSRSGCFLHSSTQSIQAGQTTTHNVALAGSSCGLN
jgi:subtilisin family serine protease